MQGLVLTLLDFSKSYDTFWREKLLLYMLEASFVGFFHFLPTIEFVYNSTTFVAPVAVSTKVSHKVLYWRHYYSYFISAT